MNWQPNLFHSSVYFINLFSQIILSPGEMKNRKENMDYPADILQTSRTLAMDVEIIYVIDFEIGWLCH